MVFCHLFMSKVTGIDSVDDESKPETIMFDKEVPLPEGWQSDDNPPYAYYQYYMFANLTVLNHFRKYVTYNTLSKWFLRWWASHRVLQSFMMCLKHLRCSYSHLWPFVIIQNLYSHSNFLFLVWFRTILSLIQNCHSFSDLEFLFLFWVRILFLFWFRILFPDLI